MTDVPGQKQAESALDTIAGQGVLGSLCVLLMVALFITIKTLLKAKDDRIQDQKLMTEALSRYTDTAKDLAIEMNKAAANMQIEQNRTLDSLKGTLASQDKALTELRGSIAGFQSEQVNLRMAINNIKCGGKG